jgi:hypothetical protein
VYAAHGFEAASAPPEQLMAIQHRYALMSSVIDRGVLSDYKHGDELDEAVFLAAATIPCNKEDFAQAMMPSMLTQFPAEDATKFREKMQAQGYDNMTIYKPIVDGKFLEWLRSNH